MAFNEADVAGYISDAQVQIDELTDTAFTLYERGKGITYYTNKVEAILRILEALDVRVALSDFKDTEHLIACLQKTSDINSGGAELTTLDIVNGAFTLVT